MDCQWWLLLCILLACPRLVRSSARPSPQLHVSRQQSTNTTKAGLGWPNGNTVDIDQYTATGKVSWYHTWSIFSVQSANIEFVPMLWGEQNADQFAASIEDILDRNADTTSILGMNEPEQPGQANMTAEEGAQLWKSHLEPLLASHGNLRLGSPAISSAPAGKVWLQDFIKACENCNVSFIAAHWYGTNSSWFISYVEDLAASFKLPIWITEWACQNYVDLDEQCSTDEVFSFMNTTQSFMDNSTLVERYAWFGAMKETQGLNPDDAIMDSRGMINTLGRQYIGQTKNQTSSSAPSLHSDDGRSVWVGVPLTSSVLVLSLIFSVFLI